MQLVSSRISDYGRSEKPHSERSHRREDSGKSEELVVMFDLHDTLLSASLLRCLVGELFIQGSCLLDCLLLICHCCILVFVTKIAS